MLTNIWLCLGRVKQQVLNCCIITHNVLLLTDSLDNVAFYESNPTLLVENAHKT